jgi:hypothetical protein
MRWCLYPQHNLSGCRRLERAISRIRMAANTTPPRGVMTKPLTHISTPHGRNSLFSQLQTKQVTMPTFKPQLRIPTLRLLSTASRPKEGTTRIINDPASSKAADESRPTTGGGEDALTVEVGSRQVDKQGGEVVSPHRIGDGLLIIAERIRVCYVQQVEGA